MSLSIDPRRISGVYALGQWFKVVPNTFSIDSFDLVDYPSEHVPFGSEPQADYCRIYSLGLAYPRQAALENGHLDAGALPPDTFYPEGFNGVRFIDPGTKEEVCLSLAECKAFRMVSREEAMAEDDRLTPEPGREIGLHL